MRCLFLFFCCSFYIDPCLLCIKPDDETITSISMFPNEADTSILLFYNQFMLKLLLAPKKSQKKKPKKKLENAEVMAIDEGMKETDSKCAHRN